MKYMGDRPCLSGRRTSARALTSASMIPAYLRPAFRHAPCRQVSLDVAQPRFGFAPAPTKNRTRSSFPRSTACQRGVHPLKSGVSMDSPRLRSVPARPTPSAGRQGCEARTVSGVKACWPSASGSSGGAGRAEISSATSIAAPLPIGGISPSRAKSRSSAASSRYHRAGRRKNRPSTSFCVWSPPPNTSSVARHSSAAPGGGAPLPSAARRRRRAATSTTWWGTEQASSSARVGSALAASNVETIRETGVGSLQNSKA
mmetsp:Transcript_80533/g.215008  ORF Transcript_80533/g.215008 Transcript_80533/m.215008 type:complete len:258 (-) Transcript_80533:20-793(-)